MRCKQVAAIEQMRFIRPCFSERVSKYGVVRNKIIRLRVDNLASIEADLDARNRRGPLYLNELTLPRRPANTDKFCARYRPHRALLAPHLKPGRSITTVREDPDAESGA
jgi:hypothetical protein